MHEILFLEIIPFSIDIVSSLYDSFFQINFPYFPSSVPVTDTTQTYKNLREVVPKHTDIFTQTSVCFKRNIHFWLCFQSGHFSEDMIPTVGFNMRKVSKGNVTIKVLFPSLVVKLKQYSPSVKGNNETVNRISCKYSVFFKLQIWDIGGQPRFRSMWERYCRGVNAIVWVF